MDEAEPLSLCGDPVLCAFEVLDGCVNGRFRTCSPCFFLREKALSVANGSGHLLDAVFVWSAEGALEGAKLLSDAVEDAATGFDALDFFGYLGVRSVDEEVFEDFALASFAGGSDTAFIPGDGPVGTIEHEVRKAGVRADVLHRELVEGDGIVNVVGAFDSLGLDAGEDGGFGVV